MTPIERALEYRAYIQAIRDFEQLRSHYRVIPVSEFDNEVWGGMHHYPDVYSYSSFMAYRELTRRRLGLSSQ